MQNVIYNILQYVLQYGSAILQCIAIRFLPYCFTPVWELTLQQTCQCFNSFPNDKILDQTKLKAFADDKFNVTKMIIAVFDGVENIVEKGEMACASNFSFS